MLYLYWSSLILNFYQEEIMLPGPKVGLIIGKNGKTIKQLQEQSGAKMVVIQDGPNTEYVSILIN